MPGSERKNEEMVKLRKDVEKTLSELGFRLLDNSVVEGRSGVYHEFDLVAKTKDGKKLTVKMMGDKGDPASIIALRICLFDTKIDKCIIVGKGISDDVVQLARTCEMNVVKDVKELKAVLRSLS